LSDVPGVSASALTPDVSLRRSETTRWVNMRRTQTEQSESAFGRIAPVPNKVRRVIVVMTSLGPVESHPGRQAPSRKASMT
jgi:hypothetical protein